MLAVAVAGRVASQPMGVGLRAQVIPDEAAARMVGASAILIGIRTRIIVGSLQVEGGVLRGTTIAAADSAALIDELPVLAAIAPYTEQGIEIRDAKELRVKESDRIAAVAENLRRMGAQLEEREDGLKIPGGQPLHGAEVDSFSDHRIAMAFAVAALQARGETMIHGAESAAISYPAFFEMLQQISQC